MRAKLRVVHSQARPQVFTKAEAVIEELSIRIMQSKDTYKTIASDCKVSHSTIANIASRKTRWPRPNTFFALLDHFDLGLELKPRAGRIR